MGAIDESEGRRQRRFWSSDEKRRMVDESFTPGASLSKVAQCYGINANLLFTRSRHEGRSAEPLQLLAVTVADALQWRRKAKSAG